MGRPHGQMRAKMNGTTGATRIMNISPVGQVTSRSQVFQHEVVLNHSHYIHAQLPPRPKDYQDHLYHLPYHYQTYPNPDHIHHHHPDQFDHQVHPCRIQTHTQYNSHYSQGPNQPQNPNKLGRPLEDKIGELLASQQSLRSCLQWNYVVAKAVQDNQQENKTSIEMMIEKASQLAEAINEIKGNLRKRLLAEHAPKQVEVDDITLETEALCEQRLPEKTIEDPREGLKEKNEGFDERLEKEEQLDRRSVKKRKKEESVACITLLRN